MFGLKEVELIEGESETPEDYYGALQSAINSLTAWKLQGSYGRAMMDAITAGKCMLGNAPTSDYYGNRIPSRSEVKEGTKGSREFVANESGEEWALLMENVE